MSVFFYKLDWFPVGGLKIFGNMLMSRMTCILNSSLQVLMDSSIPELQRPAYRRVSLLI